MRAAMQGDYMFVIMYPYDQWLSLVVFPLPRWVRRINKCPGCQFPLEIGFLSKFYGLMVGKLKFKEFLSA